MTNAIAPRTERDDSAVWTADFTSSPEAVYEAVTTPEGLSAWSTSATGSGLAGGELRF
jgi:uncharacterized protein YndB with AHSA1/START domain